MTKVEIADCEPSLTDTGTKKTSTELIAFDENHKIQYQGYCKLQINIVSKFLKVKPINENFRDITATFDWKFIKQKNIIFIFAKHVSQDFVLVFKDEEKCQKVFYGIFKKRDNKDYVEKEFLQNRFLIPIFKKIPKNGSSRLKILMRKWIYKNDETEKKEYLQLLKEYQKIQGMNDIKNVKQEHERKPRINRKRRHNQIERAAPRSHIDNNSSVCDDLLVKDENDKDDFETHFEEIIDETKFKIVNFKHQKCVRRKLLLFTSSAQTHCHEYNFYSRKNIFYYLCSKNIRAFKAILALDANGNECIKAENKKHLCSAIQYNPERYVQIKVIRKPNYEIIENCATQSKRMLIIFDSNDRNQCYEYFWCSRKFQFRCCGCARQKKFIMAEVCHENTEAEYLLILNNQHVCEIRNYDPKKYPESNQFVISPNFEIQTKIKDGIERKTLIIFYGNDRKLCYTYHLRTNTNIFNCNGCARQKKVSANIYQDDDGEEYVILSNVKHVCSPKEYISQPKELILRPPNVKLIELSNMQKSKLLIFDSNDSKLCYTFSETHISSKRYYCVACSNVRRKNENYKGIVSVFLYKNESPNDDDDGYYVKMMDGQKHKCKPQKYDPEKYEKTILKPKDDYIIFRNNCRKSIHLAVYHPENKTLCYKFHSQRFKSKSFYCTACILKNKCISAKLQQDSDGNEFLVMNQKKHICKPMKYSSIIKPGIVFLEKSGLSFEEDEPEDVDESRIVRLPNFELHRNIYGVPERKLIVFKNGNRNSCHIYTYMKSNGHFYCRSCKVSAKVIGEDDEKYIILGKNEHKCKPIEYEPEIKIIKAPDFIIFNQDDDSKPTKLIIFASPAKDFCYAYTFESRSKLFLCCGCRKMKKKITAKLFKNPNGEECAQLSKNDHICTPKKFVLEEFQRKTVPENRFKLFSNRNGKPNTKLMIFDTENDGFVYEYLLEKKNFFTCNGCIRLKKHTVTAKLYENENGEKYVELSKEKHICKSIKYDPKKLLENKKLFKNFYIHHNKFGAPKSRLTILNDTDHNLGYPYFWNSQNKFFICAGCYKFKKSTYAKLLIDKNGKEFVELSKEEHSCSIKNLKEKKMIFENFKFEEDGNILLITNDSKRKYYKFKYDSSLDAFCCIKCKEAKKKIITATIFKDKNEKEFVLLNDVHFCN